MNNQDIILVTGAEGNIARRIVDRYLKKGHKVIGTDIFESSSNTEALNDKNYEYYKLDVTDVKQIEEVCKKVEEKYGKITHLVSAAGGPVKTEIDGIETVTIEEINKSIALNLTSHIYLSKIFHPLLDKEEGENKTITFISSVNAIKTFNLPVYSAAKSGIYGLMRALVKDFGKKGIRINTISPGTVPSQEELDSNGDFYNYRYKEMMPFGDFTKPEDIADAIYAVTHVMKGVTGQNIVVDLGQTS